MKKEEYQFKPTVLDYAILGLLQDKPKSGYSIRKVFETTALGIYSSSPGSIYPALKRLEKNGLIAKKEVEKTNKTRFHINALGLQILRNWLLKSIEKIDVERNREELFLKFAFMENLLSVSEKLVFLESFHSQLKAYIQELKAYHKKESETMPIHGRLSFEHGIASCQTTLNWCKKTLAFFKKQSEGK